MKTKQTKEYDRSVDCVRTVDTEVNTVDGPEKVHINMATGEITYGPDACGDQEILKDTPGKEGYEVEEGK